jgi:hypothetical protein
MPYVLLILMNFTSSLSLHSLYIEMLHLLFHLPSPYVVTNLHVMIFLSNERRSSLSFYLAPKFLMRFEAVTVKVTVKVFPIRSWTETAVNLI